jgi:hypothetical protein
LGRPPSEVFATGLRVSAAHVGPRRTSLRRPRLREGGDLDAVGVTSIIWSGHPSVIHRKIETCLR